MEVNGNFSGLSKILKMQDKSGNIPEVNLDQSRINQKIIPNQSRT